MNKEPRFEVKAKKQDLEVKKKTAKERSKLNDQRKKVFPFRQWCIIHT
jgi:hypothetical protein